MFDVLQWFLERLMTPLTAEKLTASENPPHLLTILILVANDWK